MQRDEVPEPPKAVEDGHVWNDTEEWMFHKGVLVFYAEYEDRSVHPMKAVRLWIYDE